MSQTLLTWRGRGVEPTSRRLCSYIPHPWQPPNPHGVVLFSKNKRNNMTVLTQDSLPQLLGFFPVSWPILLAVLYLSFCVFRSCLTAFAPNLRCIPGPAIARFTRFYRPWKISQGDAPVFYRKLHAKYGPIVRTGPNSVDISDPKAVTVIYGINSKFLKVGEL